MSNFSVTEAPPEGEPLKPVEHRPTEAEQLLDALGVQGRIRRLSQLSRGIRDHRVEPRDRAIPHLASAAAAGANTWLSVSEFGTSGNGDAENVVAVNAFTLDLDDDKVRGGRAGVERLLGEISELLGAKPRAVVDSGHGLQPHFAIDDVLASWEPGDAETRQQWTDVFEAAHEAVRYIAAKNGGDLDTVDGIERLWRMPGSTNTKADREPVAARLVSIDLDSDSLTLADLRDVARGVLGEEKPAASASVPRQEGAPVIEGAQLQRWARAAVDGVLVDLRAIHDWPEGYTDDRGRGWEKRIADAAYRCGAVLKAPGAGLDVAHVKQQFLDAAPRGGDVDDPWLAEKWDTQTRRSTPATPPPDKRFRPDLATTSIEAGTEAAAERDDEYRSALERFWARPVHAQLCQFARARRVSPYSLLGCVLARVAVAQPARAVLPPTVGSHASINVFVGLVGPSGAGKGASEGAAADAISILGSADPYTASVGSGEGLAHAYAHREKGELITDREAVLFSVPEVDTLAALGTRQGATLLPQLRSAYSGEALGFQYADASRRILLKRHSYRMALVVGIQPGRAGALLDDSDGGTPQRFLWLPTGDPEAPEVAPAEPEPVTVKTHVWPPASRGLVELVIPQSAREAISAARLAQLRGGGDPLDGHRALTRLKVAAVLALLDSRRDVSEDDWDLAGILMAVSDRTRAAVVDELRLKAQKDNTNRAQAEGVRQALASDVAARHGAQRVSRRLRTLLQDHGEQERSALRRRLASRDREHFEDALALLERTGDAVVRDTEHGTRVAPAGH